MGWLGGALLGGKLALAAPAAPGLRPRPACRGHLPFQSPLSFAPDQGQACPEPELTGTSMRRAAAGAVNAAPGGGEFRRAATTPPSPGTYSPYFFYDQLKISFASAKELFSQISM